MVEIGDDYRFIPTAYTNGYSGGGSTDGLSQHYVNGTVTMIHWEHRWFRVAYQKTFAGHNSNASSSERRIRMNIVLTLVCIAFAIALIRTWQEKNYWEEMFIKERRKGNPGMWYCGKDGEWLGKDS